MNQCVPSWDFDDIPSSAKNPPQEASTAYFTAPTLPMLDNEVTELTWQNGQLALQGLGYPRNAGKPLSSSSKGTWEKPRVGGTLESLVNEATRVPHNKAILHSDEFASWCYLNHATATAGGVAVTPYIALDALVPCANPTISGADYDDLHVPSPNNTSVDGCSTRVGSCNGWEPEKERECKKRAKVSSHVSVTHDGNSRNQSESTNATFGRDSRHVTVETWETNPDVDFTSTSSDSLENRSSGMPGTSCTAQTTVDDHDSSDSTPQEDITRNKENKTSYEAPGKSSLSRKRSRAAAVHSQYERKRRHKINQRIKTLQKMVPNSSKTDKASVLGEVIEYLKKLQGQVEMMNKLNMPEMVIPMTVQQQLQMSTMIAQMGISVGLGMRMYMGMGMGTGMGTGTGMGAVNMNSIRQSSMAGTPPVLNPTAFIPLASWDGVRDRSPVTTGTLMPNLLAPFPAPTQIQPITMDAYNRRMAALFQHLHQPTSTYQRR